MKSENSSFGVWKFQSPQVTEICAHLSDREKEQLRRRSLKNSLIMGGAIGAFTSIAAKILRKYFALGDGLGADVALGALLALVAGFLLLPWANRSLKVFLASTEYAKGRGITAGDIRIYSFLRNRAARVN